jgi:hypothetical protein
MGSAELSTDYLSTFAIFMEKFSPETDSNTAGQ